MEEDKRKLIEEKLRQLLSLENSSPDEHAPVRIRKPLGTRVIRRRKGMPDLRIA